MSKSIDTLFWNALGRKGPLLFGEECGSAAVWMLLVLIQRSILILLRIEQYVPSGLIFAFPILIQVCRIAVQCRLFVLNLVAISTFVRFYSA